MEWKFWGFFEKFFFGFLFGISLEMDKNIGNLLKFGKNWEKIFWNSEFLIIFHLNFAWKWSTIMFQWKIEEKWKKILKNFGFFGNSKSFFGP